MNIQKEGFAMLTVMALEQKFNAAMWDAYEICRKELGIISPYVREQIQSNKAVQEARRVIRQDVTTGLTNLYNRAFEKTHNVDKAKEYLKYSFEYLILQFPTLFSDEQNKAHERLSWYEFTDFPTEFIT